MIPLEVSTRASFKKHAADKRGSIYVEASMVMPLTCFIIVALMGIMMTFHGELSRQIKLHKDGAAQWSCSSELILIRNYERFIDWIEK